MRPRRTQRHLPACMYLRHGAYYYVKHGKWVRLSASLAEAMEMYGRIVAGRSGGGMAQLIEEALPAITRDVKPSTARQYTAAAMRLREVLVEFAAHEVRQRDVAAIKQHYADTPNMANRLLTVLRLVMAYAVERQIIDTNPCTGIKPHKEAKRDRLIALPVQPILQPDRRHNDGKTNAKSDPAQQQCEAGNCH